MNELKVIPLIGDWITYSDIILPPLLIGLSILIYDVTHLPPKSRSRRAYLFYNQTHHARFLPSTSNHLFKYSILQFGLDLDQLERHQLNLPYLFGYIQNNNTSFFNKPSPICSISPKHYLYKSLSNPISIKFTLLEHLRHHYQIDVDNQIGTLYLITMPSYFGLVPMNPLSVYFGYKPNPDSEKDEDVHPPLSIVVLEVHNTFSERHLYVLQVGINQDLKPQSGYEYQWTFPRSFHVSPFNDRSGFYQVCLIDPFAHSKPKLSLKVTLFTNDGKKKLFASLTGSALPLTGPVLIRGLITYPFSLLLTSARIMYQSFFLHFSRPRLDVYPRPEPHSNLGKSGPNPVQDGGKVGSVGWQRPDLLSRLAKRVVLAYLTKRVIQLAAECAAINEHQIDPDSEYDKDEQPNPLPPRAIKLLLRPTDLLEPSVVIAPPSTPDLMIEELIIDYNSPRFFLDILIYPSPSLALLVGGQTEGRWTVSSRDNFVRLFERSPSGPQLGLSPTSSSLINRALANLRLARLEWAISFLPATERVTRSKRVSWFPPPYYLPIDLTGFSPPGLSDEGSLKELLVVGLATLEDMVGYGLVKLLKIRYRLGTEPWTDWVRAIIGYGKKKVEC
ncbi:hypothetical protein CROQUDRAFT_712667, partial [Cronartium quercuum f. sp. fusiforme G11]